MDGGWDMSISAMKQALEALESATPKYTRQRADQKTLGGALDYWKLEQHQRLKAITSIDQAIAEAEKQEPKCVVIVEVFGKDWRLEYMSLPVGRHKLYAQQYLYTHPQPKREWVGLTDEERDEICLGDESKVRTVEALLKEKNT